MVSRLSLLLALLFACGTQSSWPDASVGADAGEDAPLDGSGSFGDGFSGDGGSVVVTDMDASVEDGGWFMCGQCPCDGRTHYCDIGSGPGAPMSGDASDDACAGYTTCTPLPDGCAPARCSCLIPSNGPCTCYVDDSGAGMLAGCVYP